MLQKLQKRKENGFTIIEVLIVLAIAGLILLVVFLAVPALQRNARNTQRKNDVAALLGAASEYVNNHSGALPTQASDVTSNAKMGYYSAGNITFATNNSAVTSSVDVEHAHIKVGAKCNANGDNVGGSNPASRAIAIVYTVETAGGSTNICTES